MGEISIKNTLSVSDTHTKISCEKTEKNPPFVCVDANGKETFEDWDKPQKNISENFKISKTEKGKYRVMYDGVELPFAVATEKNADNMVIMTRQALVQYTSCMDQRLLLSDIEKKFVDCKFSAKASVFSDMDISIKNSILSKTVFIKEDQFRKALERILKKRGNEVTL